MIALPDKDLGKGSYETYCSSPTIDWKNFRGEPCPQWDDLTTAVKEGWNAVARQQFSWPPPLEGLEDLQISMILDDVISRAILIRDAQKINARGRRWAIFVTELEKANAWGKHYCLTSE